MKVVVFHRPQRNPHTTILHSDPWDFWGNFHNNSIGTIRQQLLEPMTNRKIYLHQPTEETLSIRFTFAFYSQRVDQTIVVPLTSRSYLSFWYREGLQRVDVLNEDFDRHNARLASLCHEMADLAGAMGRIIVLDDCALLYLRGSIDDIPGFENVVVQPHEHSTWAFAKYSPKAKAFLEELQSRKDAAQQWCLVDKVIALEKEVEKLKAQLSLKEDQQ